MSRKIKFEEERAALKRRATSQTKAKQVKNSKYQVRRIFTTMQKNFLNQIQRLLLIHVKIR